MTPHLFYTLTTGGPDTNLQLETLAAARREWVLLNHQRHRLQRGPMLQKCVLVCNLLTMSISQLLGQNVLQSTERVDDPKTLLDRFLTDTGLDALRATITDLIDYYDDGRHFGRTPKATKHEAIASLTIQRTEEYVAATLQLWNVAIKKAKGLPFHDLDDFDDIESAIDNIEQFGHEGSLLSVQRRFRG